MSQIPKVWNLIIVITSYSIHYTKLYDIAIEPAFASAYFNKANSQANMESYREAINTYLETFEHEEPEALTYYYVGECYEKLEDFHQAIAYYERNNFV